MFPKIMQKCSKLYAFSLILDLKTSGNTLFIAIPQLLGDFDQTGNHMQTIPRNPPFRQGVICHIWSSQFWVHREQTQGVKLGNSKIANYDIYGYGYLNSVFSIEWCPSILWQFLHGEDRNGKKGNMWSSIFSLVTKVRKHVLVCVMQLHQKIGTKCRGYFWHRRLYI